MQSQCLIEPSINWLIDWWFDCVFNWLIDWWFDCVFNWLIDWLIDWLTDLIARQGDPETFFFHSTFLEWVTSCCASTTWTLPRGTAKRPSSFCKPQKDRYTWWCVDEKSAGLRPNLSPATSAFPPRLICSVASPRDCLSRNSARPCGTRDSAWGTESRISTGKTSTTDRRTMPCASWRATTPIRFILKFCASCLAPRPRAALLADRIYRTTIESPPM